MFDFIRFTQCFTDPTSYSSILSNYNNPEYIDTHWHNICHRHSALLPVLSQSSINMLEIFKKHQYYDELTFNSIICRPDCGMDKFKWIMDNGCLRDTSMWALLNDGTLKSFDKFMYAFTHGIQLIIFSQNMVMQLYPRDPFVLCPRDLATTKHIVDFLSKITPDLRNIITFDLQHYRVPSKELVPMIKYLKHKRFYKIQFEWHNFELSDDELDWLNSIGRIPPISTIDHNNRCTPQMKKWCNKHKLTNCRKPIILIASYTGINYGNYKLMELIAQNNT